MKFINLFFIVFTFLLFNYNYSDENMCPKVNLTINENKIAGILKDSTLSIEEKFIELSKFSKQDVNLFIAKFITYPDCYGFSNIDKNEVFRIYIRMIPVKKDLKDIFGFNQ